MNQYVNHLFVDIINVFVEKGYRVTLITGGIYCDKSRLDKAVKVIKLNSYRRSSFLNRIFSWCFFTLVSFFVLVFSKGKKVLSSNPPLLFPIYSLLKLTFHTRLYLVIYDLYPEALISLGYFKEDSLLIKTWKKANRRLFEKSSAIFTISNNLREGISSYGFPESDLKIHSVPVWGDDVNIKRIPKRENPFVKKHDLSSFFVVQYSGNFGLTHDIETILEAAADLRDEYDVKFVLIGDGAKRRLIERYVDEHALENVVLLPWQPVENLANSLSSADLALITLSKNAELVSLPSKTFSYMKAGVALAAISSKESDLAQLLLEYECGIVSAPGDGSSLSAKILSLKKNKKLLVKLSENSLLASAFFSSANARKFHEVIDRD